MVWHHNLTNAQTDRLEALQKHALHIILHAITLPYNTALAYCETESLKLRRIFRINSLNRFVILRTASMTCSHLNATLLFLSNCGILQFTLSPKLEQIGTAHSLIMHLKSINDHCFMIIVAPFYLIYYILSYYLVFSVLWHCWLGGRKGIRPVKNGGMVEVGTG